MNETNLMSRGADFQQELTEAFRRSDPWDYDAKDLFPVQFAALRDRFHERRGQLKVLDQRARDEGIADIASLADVVPLLFSHTTYKSYPASFIQNGRWDMMNRWLGTLATQPTTGVDVTGVTDVDGWAGALHKAGHLVVTSSGTTGLTSYLDRTTGDHEWARLTVQQSTEVATGQKPERAFRFFWGGPETGFTMGVRFADMLRETYALPGESHSVSKEDISVADLDRLAMARKALIDGTATPGMIASVERDSEERMVAMEANIQRFFDAIFASRDQPIYMFMGTSMIWRLVEAGRSRGLKDGAFHPQSILRSGGGMKGFKGPADYREEALRFFGFGAERWVTSYGMTEINQHWFNCSAGRYHYPPSVIPIMLDKSGTRLLDAADIVEGRGGFFDLTMEGHWGGVISGDRLKVDFRPCPCGRKSPSVVEIARYKDLPEGDEKLTCAGQIDSYVRGFAGEA